VAQNAAQLARASQNHASSWDNYWLRFERQRRPRNSLRINGKTTWYGRRCTTPLKPFGISMRWIVVDRINVDNVAPFGADQPTSTESQLIGHPPWSRRYQQSSIAQI